MSHLNSALFTGSVRHRRYHPIINNIEYQAFMVWLNLDEADEVFQRNFFWGLSRWALARFKRDDFFTLRNFVSTLPKHSAMHLKDHVCTAFERETGCRPHTICMMTNLRYFGYSINPVTFYYAYDKNEKLIGILAEITNTPWDERFHYTLVCNKGVCHADTGCISGASARGILPVHIHTKSSNKTNNKNDVSTRRFRFEFDKVFHVSPFNPLNMKYIWSMPEIKDECFIHMQTLNQASDLNSRLDFDASMTMQRQPLTSQSMSLALLQYPFMTFKVVWGIYSNALRLWLKKSPFYDHPENNPEQELQNNIQKSMQSEQPK